MPSSEAQDPNTDAAGAVAVASSLIQVFYSLLYNLLDPHIQTQEVADSIVP